MTKFQLNQENLTFDKITDPQADAVYGRLKMLEDLKHHIEVLQESYTRLLVVNDKNSDAEFKHTLLEHELPPAPEPQPPASPPSAAGTAACDTHSASV